MNPFSPDPAAPQSRTNVLAPLQQGRLDRAALSFRRFVLEHEADAALPLDEWSASFPGSPDHAALFRDLHRADPSAALRLAEAMAALPDVGTRFAGFDLIRELGRGAFAR